MKKAILYSLKRGKLKGQVCFVLVNEDETIVAASKESYATKQEAELVISENFPDFTIEDETDTIQEVELIEE